MKIIEKKTLAAGNWLTLNEITYRDHNGEHRKWESVERRHTGGAVLLLVTLHPTGRTILIRQFRPPAASAVIEFPAGLIDAGETPEQAAVRELREETGYRGTVRSVSRAAYNSPGLTSECIYLVRMDVQEDEQSDLSTDFDETESIETFPVAPSELSAFLDRAIQQNNVLDAKVLAYSMALEASEK